MRFTRKNWEKFFDGSNKQTTIRLKKTPTGKKNAYAGSYYKPELLGTFNITQIWGKKYKDLDVFDAARDGFSSLEELKTELMKLNGIITHDTICYIHECREMKRQ